MVAQTRLTVEEFDRIASLPENAHKRIEFIGGEILEVVTNNYASMIAARFILKLGNHIEGKGLGYITGADGGYMVSGERYIPDVAFISKTKQPKPSFAAYNPQAPDLAVEVISPSDLPKDITDKVANYLAAGTLVWVVYPDRQEAKVYQLGLPVKTILLDGVLDGGDVLPGFKLPLKDIFSQ